MAPIYVVGLASPSCNTGEFTFSHTEMTKRLCLQRLSFQLLSHSRKFLLSVESQSIMSQECYYLELEISKNCFRQL